MNFGIFDNNLLNLVLIIQSSVLMYYIIMLLIFIIKKLIESQKLYKINQDDKDKFKYYRDIINDYSISELGYIFNGRKKTQLLILAELEYLKLKKAININDNKINILDNNNFKKTEKYILEHYKFINDKEFEKYYLSCIENSLKEKSAIVPFKIHISGKVILSLFIMLISFFVSWTLILNSLDNINNTIYMIIEFSLFLLTCSTTLISMLIFNKEHILVKTPIGHDIYMKLNGLKKYIKDFGNFEDRKLEEITLWEEYILYAIILNESNAIESDAKKELDELIKIIYK